MRQVIKNYQEVNFDHGDQGDDGNRNDVLVDDGIAVNSVDKALVGYFISHTTVVLTELGEKEVIYRYLGANLVAVPATSSIVLAKRVAERLTRRVTVGGGRAEPGSNLFPGQHVSLWQKTDSITIGLIVVVILNIGVAKQTLLLR